MRNWNYDKKRAADLIDLLQDPETDFQTKEEIRAWYWSDVSKEAKVAAVIDQFRQLMPNAVPDENDKRKFSELARLLNFEESRPTGIVRRKGISVFRTSVRIAFGLAASLFVLFGIYRFVYSWGEDIPITEKPIFAEVTEAAKDSERVIELPDGSSVTLCPGAEIQYPSDFIRNRTVSLVGEAVFDVVKSTDAHGERQPFTVSAGQLTVNVHGTIFRVTDSADEDLTTVALYQGSVSVETGSDTTELSRGEAFNLNRETKAYSVSLISAGEMINNGVQPLLRFERSSLGNLITSLEANYKVSFVVPAGIDLDKGGFTGDFEGEPLDRTLRMLTKANKSLAFIRREDKVYVTRK